MTKLGIIGEQRKNSKSKQHARCLETDLKIERKQETTLPIVTSG